MAKPLPIVDENRERQDAKTLAAAQRHLDHGRPHDARALLAPLVEEPTTAVRAHATLLYAGLALMGADAEAALAALGKLPAHPSFALDDGYRRMLQACALRQLRRFEDALDAATLSIAAGETSGRLLVLADAQKHVGKLDEAIGSLLRLLDKEPDHATALAQLAGYRNLKGELDDGARVFERFVDVADDSADAKRNAAFYFATKNDLDATVRALSMALKLEPDVTRGYIDDEIELDRFRAHPAFVELLSP